MEIKITNQNGRTVATLHNSDDFINLSGQFPEAATELYNRIRDEDIVEYVLDFDNPVPNFLQNREPAIALMKFNSTSMILQFMRLQLIGEWPIIRMEREGVLTRIRAINDVARNMFVAMMGHGARAIFQLAHHNTELCMISESRPAGRTPSEVYEVQYTTGTGEMAHTCRQTATREELLDIISNPEFYKITVGIV